MYRGPKCPTSPLPSREIAHVTPGPRRSGAATSKAETNKHSKYDRPVASMNPPLKLRVDAIALNDFGGIGSGFEFYSTVVKPYFEKLREKEPSRRRRLVPVVRAGTHARRSRSSCREPASRWPRATPESSTVCATIGNLPPHQTWSLAQCTTCALWPPLVTQTHTTQRRPGPPQRGLVAL